MKNYSFEEFINDLEKITTLLKKENFEAILAISRGGLTFAHFLAERLNIRKVYSIGIISYDKDKKLDTLKIYSMPEIKEKNILIVDDISDSGDTFLEVLKHFKGKTASIFYKPTSKYKPDFFMKKTSKWITFFWENQIKERK